MRVFIYVLSIMLLNYETVDADSRPHYTKKQLQNAIYRTAKNNRINSGIALAVVEVESTWNPNSIRKEKKGDTVSVGLFQMYLPTAKHYGFKGNAESLKEPSININLGVNYLALKGEACKRLHG